MWGAGWLFGLFFGAFISKNDEIRLFCTPEEKINVNFQKILRKHLEKVEKK